MVLARGVVVGVAALVLVCGLPATAAEESLAADYEAAAALLEGNLSTLIKNASVSPHWTEEGFWYRRHGDDGAELVVYDLDHKKRSLAFDHGRIAKAIGRALGEELAGFDSLTNVALSSDLETLTAQKNGKVLTCTLADATCKAEQPPPPEQGLLRSPDGRFAALTRNDDLFLRELDSGEETALTDDGKPFYSYGKWPDSSLMTITVKKSGARMPPYAGSWSPDGRYLLAPRIDERLLDTVPFVEWVPTDGSRRPIVHSVREALPGERDGMEVDWFVFDIEKKTRVAVDLHKEQGEHGERGLLSNGGVLHWDSSGGRAFMLAGEYAGKAISLVELDLVSGAVREVVREEAKRTRVEANTLMYNKPNVRVFAGGERAVWYSDRTGWGHLYLLDTATGELLKAVTEGQWAVIDVHHLDEQRQEIYFTGGGREPGRDPYYRHLYKASLDPKKPTTLTLLTDADADHHFRPAPVPMISALFGVAPPQPMIRPDLGVLIDTYSTVDQPPVTVLRSTEDGRVLAELERADAGELFQRGYRVPERRAFKAADGKTDIYSVYIAPKRSLEGGKHPVIDAVYGGPQVFVAPRNFVEAVTASNPVGDQALSRLGFAVVITDGRGTPGRSSSYRDDGYVEFTQVGIEDHIAAIEAWARLKPEMDLERVGIYGWSWGGTFTAQAILSHPEFYDVAVSGAGVYDYAAVYPGFESVTGAPVYEDGSRYKTRRGESPSTWEALDITRLAPNLAGKLLLVYGDMDENVPQAQAMRLVDALVKANRPYDLLYLPNRTHAAGSEPYTLLRTWDYFVEHLLDMEPPRDVSFENERVVSF